MNDETIVKEYVAGLSSYELGQKYNLSARQIQRIVKKAGKSRTISESYRLAIKNGRVTYYRKPEHLKAKRLRISDKMRFVVMTRDNYKCVLCGTTAKECMRLEVDHIDNDATNNTIENLQTLCDRCNKGKAWAN